MKCVCCDSILSDFEATRKHAETRQYLDTCSDCLSVINQDFFIHTLDRADLFGKDDSFVDTPNLELDKDGDLW